MFAFVYMGRNWALSYCDHNLHIGLLLIGIFYLFQVTANFYIVYKYSKEYGKYSEANDSERKGICSVTVRFLCYDFFMCFYMIFLLFSIIWSSIYIGYAASNTRECSSSFT